MANTQIKCKGHSENHFRSLRVTRNFHGTIPAAPETIFPLLCSTKEAEWLPGSNHKLIYSETGYAENGYIFQSDFFGFGLETWVRFEHNPNESLAYVRCSENLVIIFRIDLIQTRSNSTDIGFSLMFTSLTNNGNRILAELPDEMPFGDVVSALSHYINFEKPL